MDKEIRDIWDDISWYERCILIQKFHKSKREAKGNKRGERWTIRDTAGALDYSLGYISEALKLAKEIKKDSSLKKFSRDKALAKIREDGRENI